MLDEVLKLFHSGHAQAILARLRDFGLFRFLFPFTEESFIIDEVSLAELGMRNTDQRIQEGKPVIPAFLFACMLWEPMRDDIEKLTDNRVPYRQAFMTAMDDILRDQSQYVSIPKRIGFIVKDIWLLQGRLEHRSMKNVKTALAHKRFRAAYDFLLLRAEVGEVQKDLAEWWTRIQEVEPGEQDEMIKALNIRSRNGRNGSRRNAQGNTSQGRNQDKSQGRNQDKSQDKNQGRSQGRKQGKKQGGNGEAADGNNQGARNGRNTRNGRGGRNSRRRRRKREYAA
jgi:poly(A) polymerase